jgi:Flp pilus assembly pilin Flp
LTARRLVARLRALEAPACHKHEGLPLAWAGGAPGGTQGRPGGHAQSGQGLVEYGVILAIMAVACVVSLVFFGDQLSALFSLIASAV